MTPTYTPPSLPFGIIGWLIALVVLIVTIIFWTGNDISDKVALLIAALAVARLIP